MMQTSEILRKCFTLTFTFICRYLIYIVNFIFIFCSLVVNYDFPRHIADYVNRVGRTGRADNAGLCISYLNDSNSKIIPELIKVLQKTDQVVSDELKQIADQQMQN